MLTRLLSRVVGPTARVYRQQRNVDVYGVNRLRHHCRRQYFVAARMANDSVGEELVVPEAAQ